MGVVAAVVTTGVVWESSGASAASFTQIPERLYMAPGGDPNILDGIAAFVGVDVGTLVFDGDPDPISGDLRQIVVEAAIGDQGCDLSDIDENDPANAGKTDYDIDDCPRVQMSVAHGTLYMGAITLDDVETSDGSPNPADPVYILPSGAVTDIDYGSGASTVGINGTPAQLNDALAALVYTPNPDYYYVGSNAETLTISIIPGNGDDVDPPESTDSETRFVEIRVLSPNQFPTHTGPAAKPAEPGIELQMPENPSLSRPFVADAGAVPPIDAAEFTVGDPDNDELIDVDSGDPGELPDGEDENMMLIGFLECGQPVLNDPNIAGTDHGFHFRGGTFQSDDVQIQDFFEILYDVDANPDYQLVIDALVAGLDAIDPDLKNITLATSAPTDYTTAFAGVGDILTVEYALSQITFLHDAPNDTCTLITVVLDLGNNGLPLQYVGSPPTGIEVPFLGFDWNVLEITTGDIETIDVSFETSDPIVVSEAAAPTPATARLRITPASHPEFTIKWDAVPGTALAGEDYAATSNNTLTIPADAEFYPLDPVPLPSENPIETMVLDNDNPADAPIESFTFEIITDQNTPPPGWAVTSSVSTKTVNIVDDDGADAEVTSFADASLTEGDSGTTMMTFTVQLDKPADGTESADVTATPVSATNPDDYTGPAPNPVTFAPGATSATIQVPIAGDLLDEGDHTFILTLSNPMNLTLGDATATGTIVDDDQTRTASIVDASVVEGDAGTVDLSFTVSLDQPAKGFESLTVSTANVVPGATAGVDYTALTNWPVAFAADQETATVTVVVNGDTDIELDETFTISLGSALNVDIGIGTATGTITNDDGVIAVSVNDVTVAEGNAGTTNATFTVSLAEPAVGTETITITTSDGTATDADDDYEPGTQGLTFAVGATTATFTVLVNGDSGAEADETFGVTLSAPQGLVIADGTGVGTITNDDAPTVTVNQAVGQVDPTSTSPILFTVVFSGPVTGFSGSDVAFTGSTTDATLVPTVSGGPQTYTVSVEATGATATGTVVASVPAGAATSGSVSSLASTSTDNSVTLEVDPGDVTAPSVTVNQAVGQVDPTSVSPILFTVVFSEPVTGFVTGDVTLAGTAGATTAVVTDSGDAMTFSVAVSGMTQDGTVIASVAAGVAADAAANANVVSTSTDNVVTYDFDEGDVTAPSVTVNQAVGQVDPTAVSPILFTVVFSEPVTGFVTGDVTLAGTAGATTAVVTDSGDAMTFSVAVSGMTQDGTVIASIPAGAAVDAALNPSTASTSTDNMVTYEPDVDAPLAIDVPDDIVTGNDPGEAGAVVDFAPATASGGTPPLTVSCDRTSGQFFALGTTTVTCTASDAEGVAPSERFVEATVTATFTITVLDTEPPVIAEPPDLVRGATSAAGVAVTYATPAASDNAGPPTVTCSPASGGVFAVGVTTVTCTATDAAGNSASASFTVTVTAPASGGLPVTGADTGGVLLLAAMLVTVGLATRRIGRRGGIEVS